MVDEVSSLETRCSQTPQLVALLYHDVVSSGQYASSGFQGPDADAYKMDCEEFQSHLQAMGSARCGTRVGLLRNRDSANPPMSLLFTFDDAGASAPAIADMLEKKGWRGHFFVPTDFLSSPGFVTTGQVRDLHSRGHVIGSHSCSHPMRMAQCTRTELQREWTKSVQVLSEVLGTQIRVGSVPGGYYSRAVAEEASAAGIEVLFNSEPTTRLQRLLDCLVVGRFCIREGISPRRAARIASGSPLERTQQYLYWNFKKCAKRVGGTYYLRLRDAMFRRA